MVIVTSLTMLYNEAMEKIQCLQHIIRERRAIRSYEDRPVARDLIEKLLDGAQWAPSAHNRQPWRFAVITAYNQKENLAQAMGKRLYEDRVADGDALKDIKLDVSRSHVRITSAPVVIVLFLSMKDMDAYADERRIHAEHTMAVQSVAMAAQNLWLLAHAEGLGACWLCAPLFAPKVVRDLLQVPEDWEAQGLMTLGWPAEKRQKERRAWREAVRFY